MEPDAPTSKNAVSFALQGPRQWGRYKFERVRRDEETRDGVVARPHFTATNRLIVAGEMELRKLQRRGFGPH